MRRRSIGPYARAATLTMIAAIVLAACVPVKPAPPAPAYRTSYCGTTGAVPVNAKGYQRLFDTLRTVNADFAAADGGFPVELGDGRVLWRFADTFAGYVQPDGSIATPYWFVHNSFIVQAGGCLTPMLGGTHGARVDVVGAPPGQFFWPVAAFVDGGSLVMFLQRTATVPGNICLCMTIGIDIARFSLPGLNLVSLDPSPAPFDAVNAPVFGSDVVTEAGFHYIYGHRADEHFVARVAVGADITSASQWRYWNGGTTGTDADWTATSTDPCTPGTGGACPMGFDMPNANAGPLAGLAVVNDPGGGFMASAKLQDVLPLPVYTWWSASPVGPWTQPRFAASTPSPPGGFTYGGRVFFLPGSGAGVTPTVQYSTNAPDNVGNAYGYRVVFKVPDACSVSNPRC
jgi:hypothetical protein